MRLLERPCAVCGAPVDPSQTSAHLARVIWFCSTHGTCFHHSEAFSRARRARSTTEAWLLVDAWLARARVAASSPALAQAA